MVDYKYQAYICNNIVYGGLVQLRASGVPDEDIRVMMKCIGDTFARMSFDNKPIEYYMKSFENADHTYIYDQTTQELINKIMTNVGCARPIEVMRGKENENY